MTTPLTDDAIEQLLGPIRGIQAAARPVRRQPVHTLYGGAQLYKVGAARKLGDLALRSLDAYAPDPLTFGQAFGLDEDQAPGMRERIVEKLQREPVEDQRIDFEDGYGHRSDDEEDGHARDAARALAEGMAARDLPPFIGIRIKSLGQETGRRALRTLNLFIGELLAHSNGQLPDNFVICLPKVAEARQVSVLRRALQAIEGESGLDAGAIKLEIMVETTSAIINADGRCPLTEFIAAAEGRCVAAHFGTYDYTADCDITAAWQTHDHVAADFARSVMQVVLSGSGIRLSDGATTVMPVPLHRSVGATLTEQHERENREAVHSAWRLHHDNVQRSLRHGFYQSWDLNPAQLPARYVAVYRFFQDALPQSSQRLASFVEKAAQANLIGSTFDDAATGQGLLNFFLRGIACGALSIEDLEETGLSADEVAGKSFMDIVSARKAG